MRPRNVFIVFTVCSCFICAAFTSASEAVSEHLVPLPAVNFSAPAPESASIRLSQSEYEQKISQLKASCEQLSRDLEAGLEGEEKRLFSVAQEQWEVFLSSLQETLKAQLDTPVKVFYKIKGKERITNIYRDSTIAVYEQRISDLKRWKKGNFQPLMIKQENTLSSKISKEKNLINEKASRNIYLMEEKYRREEFASQKAWRDFRRSQLAFIDEAAGGAHKSQEEDLLMMRRINNIRTLQAEGLVFFKNEREE